MAKLRQSFCESERLQRHIRFLYAKGSVYRVGNGMLLFHGAIPMDEAGAFASITLDGKTYRGRAWMDHCEAMARAGYFAPEGSEERRKGQDFLWYLWCGRLSPIFGRDKMGWFEKYFIGEEAACAERKNPYYAHIESEDAAVAERAACAFSRSSASRRTRATSSTAMCPCARRAARTPSRPAAS